MNCRELVEFLWRYLEEELALVERAAFDDHLAQCPHCERYLDSYRRPIALGRDTFIATQCDARFSEPIPEEFVAAVLAARNAGRN